MKRFTEMLPAVSTPDELREVMRELVRRGSSNWTYHSASQYVAPELWEELTLYFDRVTGQPSWPEDDGSGMAAASVGNHTLSEVIRAFHARLASVAISSEANERADGSAITFSYPLGQIFDPQQTDCVGDTRFEPVGIELKATTHHTCTICLRVAQVLTDYRGKRMCSSCVELLRGY